METCPRCCLSPVTRVGQACSRCGLVLTPFEKNPWQGEELGNKTLLLVSLNSYGDVFERLRYLNGLTERGINWKLVTETDAVPLIQTLFPDASISTFAQPLPVFDVWADFRDGTSIQKTPRPPQVVLSVPKERFSFLPHPAVGLCFLAEERYVFPKFRSIGQFGAEKIISSVRNVNWVNLQYNQELPRPCLNLKLESWLDTAGLISSLDAVVTADTAIAHLCALLRKPFIVLFGTAPTSVVMYKDFKSMYVQLPIKEIKPTYGGFEGGRHAWQTFIEWANKTPEWWKPENF